MYLAAHIRRVVKTGGLLVSLWLLLMAGLGQTVSAQAALISYTLSPASSSVQPNGTVDILVTMHAQTAIGGGSLHLGFSQGSYVSFESAETAGITFVYYHPEPNDLLFICANNTCAPGSYPIATITVQAGASGNMSVSFTPKETISPQLTPLSASGATGSYDITQSAPASPAQRSSSQRRVTVPQSDGNGGTTPLQITNDQYLEQATYAQNVNARTATTTQTDDTEQGFWTVKNILIVGVGTVLGFALLILFLVLKSRSSGPRGPYGPTDGSGGSGMTAIVG